MALRVVKPGMLTTIQDLGRWGYQSRGVPVAGPMDSYSHRLANALVGNDHGAATLEITLLGPELEFESERLAAVTGAEFELTLDGRPSPSNTAFLVPAGAHLRFGARQRGARAYLAVQGGIAIAPVLGSRATHVISGLGGLFGRSLRSGDRIPLSADPSPPRRSVVLAEETQLALPSSPAVVRVLPGPQADRFASSAIDALQSAPYVIGSNSDRQTTGGYPKIATVITADLPIAAQLAPGDQIAFAVCTPREALAALIAREQPLLRTETT